MLLHSRTKVLARSADLIGMPDSKVSPFICPGCHKPVQLKESQFGSGGRLLHPACKAEQEASAPKARGNAQPEVCVAADTRTLSGFCDSR